METEDKFYRLCSQLMDMDARMHPYMDFEGLCSECGADICEMDDMLYSAFGMSGDEIITQFHEGVLQIVM